MGSILIVNANIVNEGKVTQGDLLVKNGRIEKIGKNISENADKTIDAAGKYLIPGIIDDQVHFREPGLTNKAEIYTESRAAVAGGVTSFMEMPNTVPNVLTQELLENKYAIAAEKSIANYSFFMGASNDNLEEVLKTDAKNVCGIKVFMGSSTGNMLVDNEKTLEGIFSRCPMLIATHCEDEETIRKNSALYKEKYGDSMPISMHPEIRSVEACYKSSSMAVGLAKKYGARLHVLHISTADELELFDNKLPLKDKKITAEVCVHHLWFSKDDYDQYGTYIKWNPAVKESKHKKALLQALKDDILDIVATDHAPHTKEEKNQNYWKAPSGGPLVQHSFNIMYEFCRKGELSIERLVEKMCHAPATMFDIKKRGFIREGYFADLALVDTNSQWKVSKENLLYKCGWSPLEGQSFTSKVTHTIVSGNLVWENDKIIEGSLGQRLTFDR
ncbi:dihydroorotase [Cytophagaceae bacterium ABcell3]|nr:dihydroorotase [Cytophagaceae bacterium ABcell3]